jgi:transcription factor IIIB subunit 2
MRSKCPTCGPSDTEYDNALGHVVCIGCGQVLEQDAMVTELSFSENSKGAAMADGFTLKAGQARAKAKGGFSGTGSLRPHQDSSEQTRERGHSAIERAANIQGIKMSPNLIEKAKRVFDIALTAKYTKGRKANCVIAACCYITCRMEQTSHMMIDFADAFSTNVYQIGAVFLQLRSIFLGECGGITMPLVDPGLYMARFADKLDFGNETQKVVQVANRISQRMNRDWITTGRRPAGVCAASLFIAARMNGFKRTIREIVLVVKICDGTVRMRLKEFENTESGKLSTANFETINIAQDENPPSFQKGIKRKHEQQRLQVRKKHDQQEDQEDSEVDELLNEAKSFLTESFKVNPDLMDTGESLSDLDDDPDVINCLAMSDDETEFKGQLWMAENREWVEKQEQIKQSGGTIKREIKKVKIQLTKKPKKISQKAGSAAEAARKMVEAKPSLSRKINYEVLEDLFQ